MHHTPTRPLVSAVRVGMLAALLAAGLVTRAVEARAAVAAPAADPARVWAHLVALQEIADREGGNRATDFPGYTESETYVRAVLEQAGWDVQVQPFTAVDGTVPTLPPTLAQVSPVPTTYDLGTDYALTTPPLEYGADAPVALVGITGAPDPPDGSAACQPGAFDGFPVGAIALVVHGTCDPTVVMIDAFIAGASGVGYISDGVSGEHDPVQVDVLSLGMATFSLSHAVGASLVDQVRNAGPVTLRFDSGWRPGSVESDNIIAERPGTDPSHVVLLGAHLDSVRAGPGINDNGSGVAALLALAEAWGASGASTVPTLRIGLWGAEERRILGSDAYVAGLGADQRAAITAYLNFDMLGSRNGFPFVYDPALAISPTTVSPGSDLLTARFRSYFDAAGIPTEGVWTNGRSDDVSFASVGIPVGGLFSGAEQPKSQQQASSYGGVAGDAFDSCYHEACDRLDGINVVLLDQLVAGLSVVVGDLVAAPVLPTADPLPASPVVSPVIAVPAFTG